MSWSVLLIMKSLWAKAPDCRYLRHVTGILPMVRGSSSAVGISVYVLAKIVPAANAHFQCKLIATNEKNHMTDAIVIHIQTVAPLVLEFLKSLGRLVRRLGKLLDPVDLRSLCNPRSIKEY